MFRWTLRLKISSLAAILLALMGSVSLYFFLEINKISREIEELGAADLPLYDTTQKLILRQKDRTLLLDRFEDKNAQDVPSVNQSGEAIASRLTYLEAQIDRQLKSGLDRTETAIQQELQKEGQIRLNQVKEDYGNLNYQFIQLLAVNKNIQTGLNRLLLESSNLSEPQYAEQLEATRLDLEEFDAIAQAVLFEVSRNIDSSVVATLSERQLALNINLLISLGAFLIGTGSSIWITRHIVYSVNKVTQKAQFIAEHIEEAELKNKTLNIQTNDEFHDLSVAFNRMVENFLASQKMRAQLTRKALQERNKAEWQANHDILTRLLNRWAFEDALQALWQKQDDQSHALLYLDLDRFKIVNDTCGHSAGDELLRQVSKLLSVDIRQTDSLARIGGDEFALILFDCPLDKAVSIAERILARIRQYRFVWEDQCFLIGMSIGVVAFNPQQDQPEDTINAVDRACYEAKNLGRDQVYVMQNKLQTLAERSTEMTWLKAIKEALEQGHFRLYYQSIKPLQQEEPGSEHYEILLRLEGSDGNLFSPKSFLPVAEHYKLMAQIDRWVITKLFETQGYHYREKFHNAQLKGQILTSLYSINLSGETVNDASFVEFIQAELERHQIPPSLICFEITETVAIANLVQAEALMKQLKALGFRFALDDFGSGMSSFAYLKGLPIDFLKIDGMFIRELLQDPINQLIVQSFHSVAKGLNIQTIAEFVDSSARQERLTALGIDYAQGYWIAKPQPLSNQRVGANASHSLSS